jgi:hypothetical protein
MTSDSLVFTQTKEIAMSDPTKIQNSIERMMKHMELRGLPQRFLRIVADLF